MGKESKVICCEHEMIEAGKWFHCGVCGRGLISMQPSETKEVLGQLICDYVIDYTPLWKEFNYAMHELWKFGTYEDYDIKISEEWEPKEGEGT